MRAAYAEAHRVESARVEQGQQQSVAESRAEPYPLSAAVLRAAGLQSYRLPASFVSLLRSDCWARFVALEPGWVGKWAAELVARRVERRKDEFWGIEVLRDESADIFPDGTDFGESAYARNTARVVRFAQVGHIASDWEVLDESSRGQPDAVDDLAGLKWALRVLGESLFRPFAYWPSAETDQGHTCADSLWWVDPGAVVFGDPLQRGLVWAVRLSMHIALSRILIFEGIEPPLFVVRDYDGKSF